MGGRDFADRRIERREAPLMSAPNGRSISGGPNWHRRRPGSARTHLKEQADLVDRALTHLLGE